MLSFPNAKINLGLNITEKRTDGYHNLETVFYPIQIKDAIEIIDAEETICKIFGIDVPGDTKDNICVKAYNLIAADFKLPAQQINLLKNIPVGAGLGGGSADCAFIIRSINEKFNLGLSLAQMENYARKLGSDCAFFIKNKPSFAFNKGDEFEDFPIDLSMFYKVLVKPPIHVSTADAYALVKPQRPLQSLKEILHLPIPIWRNKVINDFEMSVFAKYPQIHQIKNSLYHAGAVFALMSGSGSSVFALFNQAIKLAELEKDNLVFYNI
ncbi:4-(cytidine 5'-diphospho)-2-C-methyl-D-erythritol kinase [Pedobacter changchengzhani]|uniref:4-diphosphocytidyl-2-C-methyl-D-erythritol kinase n=1 Tax=Pedobacter changchengzhani TaxID=2529274 RepID=A0A4R5MHF4_9SPHI|nr:4-(cytidine 5'-diphospho)-2-C-methyl-D-erythritol kinase [Pedobacter changchengzhani]TDG34958.1 4-(cytidine 5'-diphospho)-2-C-methyl-D-erythritol kinase [Pedobacter changchengzhani]